MSHEKTIHDGKRKKNPLKSIKERRAQRKAKQDPIKQRKKSRWKKKQSV